MWLLLHGLWLPPWALHFRSMCHDASASLQPLVGLASVCYLLDSLTSVPRVRKVALARCEELLGAP